MVLWYLETSDNEFLPVLLTASLERAQINTKDILPMTASRLDHVPPTDHVHVNDRARLHEETLL